MTCPCGRPAERNAPQRLRAGHRRPRHAGRRRRPRLHWAAKIKKDTEGYHGALRDWVAKGAASRFALSPEQVVERSRPRDDAKALGHAHFQLAAQLEIDGHHEAAIQHFREAHRLVPDSWTFRRQAWSLEKVGEDALARFWQGPDPAKPDAWPYEGNWLKDVREIGAENYSEPWKP